MRNFDANNLLMYFLLSLVAIVHFYCVKLFQPHDYHYCKENFVVINFSKQVSEVPQKHLKWVNKPMQQSWSWRGPQTALQTFQRGN